MAGRPFRESLQGRWSARYDSRHLIGGHVMGAAIETLERRSLMSVSVAGGVLTVRGTPGDDTIQIYQIVDTNGQVASFHVIGKQPVSVPAAGIKRVVVRTGAGNDVVDLNLDLGGAATDLATSVMIPARLDGGRGDDVLFGGAGNDVILGGAGGDTLDGNGGVDRMNGGAGADVIHRPDPGEPVKVGRGDELRDPLGPVEPPAGTPPADPTELQEFAAGDKFTFRAPADMVAVPIQGIDSFVGKYSSDKYEVTFDYGWYSGTPGSTDTDLRDVT